MHLNGAIYIDIKCQETTQSTFLLEPPAGAIFFRSGTGCFYAGYHGGWPILIFQTTRQQQISIRADQNLHWQVACLEETLYLDGVAAPHAPFSRTGNGMKLDLCGALLLIAHGGSSANSAADQPAYLAQRELEPVLYELVRHLDTYPEQMHAIIDRMLSGRQQALITIRPALHPSDAAKLYQARSEMAEHLQNPPSLVELARRVGLNECKLKKEFKRLFGLTVFGYLFEQRMEKAMQLLLEGSLAVGEIAYLVGYKNTQHFTAAFKKRFGHLPGHVKRRLVAVPAK